jgi:hypothetical protein
LGGYRTSVAGRSHARHRFEQTHQSLKITAPTGLSIGNVVELVLVNKIDAADSSSSWLT